MPFLVPTNPVVTVSGTGPIVSTGGSTPVISIQDATTDQKGAVQLEDSLTSTSITKAAIPKNVKEIHDDLTTTSGILQIDIDTKLESIVEDIAPELGGDLAGGGYNLDNIGKFCSSSFATMIYNDTGATLTKGTAVTICGLDGEVCTVCKTDNREVTKMPCCGIVYADIANGAEGCGIRLGRINMNTSGMAGDIGNRIYVQSDGSLDTTIPTSGMVQRVGFLVVKASGNAGRICVCIRGPRSMYSAKDQHPTIRMGDDAGHRKICFLNYNNNEVGCIDSDGNITTSGTVDGVDVAAFKSDYDNHDHDDRYYTESEIDTISGTLSSEIDSDISTHEAGSSHDSRYYTETELDNGQLDTRYYTESEVDTVSGTLQTNIDGKANTSHNHTSTDVTDFSEATDDRVNNLLVGGDNITLIYDDNVNTLTISGSAGGGVSAHSALTELDYASAGHTGFQPAGDYTTDSELTTLSGNLQTNINSKSDTGHTHDDRYYTETEVDNFDYATNTDLTTVSGLVDINTSNIADNTILIATTSGTLQTNIDGKSDTGHTHTESDVTDLDKYTESEVDTISGSLNTKINGKDNYQSWTFQVDGVDKDDITSGDKLNFVGGDNITITRSADDQITISGSDGVTNHSQLNELDYASSGHTGFASTDNLTTVSGDLQTNIDGKPDTEVFLADGVPSDSVGKESDISMNQNIGTVYKKSVSVSDSGIFYPAASGDDGEWRSDGFSNTGDWLFLGNDALARNLWVRLLNVTIPQGATIDSAFIRFTSAPSSSGPTVNENIYFNNVDNAVAPTDKSEADALTLTGAIAWNNIGAWVDGNQYDSPELKTILQTVVDRASWSSGNALQIVGKDNGSTHNKRRLISSYDYVSAAEKAELHVEWSSPSVWEKKLTPDFLKLSDTPGTYSGSEGKYLKAVSSNIEFSEDDIYVKSEIDTISGTLQIDIDTRAISGGLEHDGFSDFVGNEHIDHSGVTITAGTGLTGGGDITTNRTLDVDVGITNDKIVQIDDLDAAIGDYAKLTASGIEGRSYAETLSDLNEAGQRILGEHDLKLDSLLSADGKYSGITCDGVLGATLAFGDLVYLNTTDQRWELTDADAEATAGDVQLAIVLVGGVDGNTRLLLLQGFIRENDWNFTSYGQALFVSCTAGDMTATAPSATGDVVRVVGHASTFADQIYFNPSGTWIEI